MLQHEYDDFFIYNLQIFLCIYAALRLGDCKVEYIKNIPHIWNIYRHPLWYEAYI